MFKVGDLVYVKEKWFRKHQKRVGRVLEIISDEKVEIMFDDNSTSSMDMFKLSKIRNFADLFDKRANDPNLVESLARQMMKLNPKILTDDKVGETLLKNSKFPKKYKNKIKEIMGQYKKKKEILKLK